MKMKTVDERLPYTAPFSWMGGKPRFMTANAGRQAPLEAAARHERRLEAVACTPSLGPEGKGTRPGAWGSPSRLPSLAIRSLQKTVYYSCTVAPCLRTDQCRS